jgi:lysophospholipase L1-like esterase
VNPRRGGNHGREIRIVWSVVRIFAALLVLLVGSTSTSAQETPLPQEWDYADAMRAVAARGAEARPAARPGVVLHVGDSITYANPYGAWALHGRGHTPDDDASLKWMHAGARDDSDGWSLASFDHPDGGRSHTAAGGMRADELLAGGKRGLPALKDLLDQYRPQAVVLLIGTNDASAGRKPDDYARDVAAALDLMLARGVVPIPSTIPPHPHRADLARAYNESLRQLARDRRLPMIDFEREVLARRPNDWNGTLLQKDDVHPTATDGPTDPASAPTAENLRTSGYLLRGWLSVKKIAEVRRAVFSEK